MAPALLALLVAARLEAAPPLNASYVTLAANYPQSVASGDFNHDSHTDLVVVTDGLSVFLGGGDGRFRLSQQSSVLGEQAIVADIDGDRNLDLIVTPRAGYSGTKLSLLLGNRNGTFRRIADLEIGGTPGLPAVGDLDRDGHPDLVVPISSSREIVVFRGLGLGGFQRDSVYTVRVRPLSVAIGDLDGNQWPDVAVAHSGTDISGGVLSIFLNQAGVLDPRMDYASGDGTRAVSIADWDRDDDLDLIVTNSAGIAVFLNDVGRPTRIIQMARSGSGPVFLQDFDRDGFLDVLSASPNGTSVAFSIGSPGALGPTVMISSGHDFRNPIGVDVDEDGWPDIVAPSRSENRVFMFTNNRGQFPGPHLTSQPGDVRQPVLADFNGDGRLDLAALYGNGVVYFARGDGSGAFPDTASRSYARESVGLAAGDCDADGRPDLVTLILRPCPAPRCTRQGSVSALLNSGALAFANGEEFPVGYLPLQVAAADLDRDGDADVVELDSDLAEGDYALRVLLNSGGAWVAHRYLWTFRPSDFVIGDANGDSIPDVMLLQNGTDVLTLIGAGDGTFRTAGTGPARPETASLANPDGRSLPRSTALGHRLEAASSSPSAWTDLGDLDGDGRLDLVVNSSSGIRALMGNGNGTFRVPYTTITHGSQHRLADLDRDGHLDLIVLDGDLVFCRGRGDGTFLDPIRFGFGTSVASIAIGDLTSDGWPDVLGIGSSGYPSALLFNRGVAGPSIPSVRLDFPGGGDVVQAGTSTEIRWTTHDAVGCRIDLLLSRDGPTGSFETIAIGVPDSGRYAWHATGPATTNAFLVVRVSPPTGPGAEARNASAFVIEAPVVRVISPGPGERWPIGATRRITWSSGEIFGGLVDLYISHGAGQWEELAVARPDSGGFSMRVTGPPTTNARIQLVVEDSLQHRIAVVSAAFEIVDAPLPRPDVRFLGPADSETLLVGEPVEIQWSASDASGVDLIDLVRAYGDTSSALLPIARGLRNRGSYAWIPTESAARVFLGVIATNGLGFTATAWSPRAFVVRNLRPPSAPRFMSARPYANGIAISWLLAEADRGVRVRIERRRPSEHSWRTLSLNPIQRGDTSVAIDRDVQPFTSYEYRLVLGSGSNAATFEALPVVAAPIIDRLALAVLNPARGVVRLSLAVPEMTPLRLSIHDLQGREVAVVIDERRDWGNYELTWDARGAGPGVYFANARSGVVTATRKFVLLSP